MSNKLPSYTFHVPHFNEPLTYEELSTLMANKRKRKPEQVFVIDMKSCKRLGSIPPTIALEKYR